jgi:hypothetical protein
LIKEWEFGRSALSELEVIENWARERAILEARVETYYKALDDILYNPGNCYTKAATGIRKGK